MLKTVIPFGPQHPVLPEPLHLKLTVEDEIIIEAIPAFGFIHRGLEILAGLRDFHQMIQVVERVCGICSMSASRDWSSITSVPCIWKKR